LTLTALIFTGSALTCYSFSTFPILYRLDRYSQALRQGAIRAQSKSFFESGNYNASPHSGPLSPN
jgi:hypothetical protein